MVRIAFIFPFLFFACANNEDPTPPPAPLPEGKLFIVGGGKRPPELMRELIEISGIDTAGYAVILPMSSGEPDSAAWYGLQQFVDLGLPKAKFTSLFLTKENITSDKLDSVKNARLIYLTGGDQRRFMELVGETELPETIRRAFWEGATVAGTSAGAALMSAKMITGDEKNHPEYTGEFRTIEADNFIIEPGLGLLPNTIVDQHFIWRMRMNRLISVALDHPEQTCIGIDESTALLVDRDSAKVVGQGQVIVLQNPARNQTVKNGLIGGRGLKLDVLLPSEAFILNH